MWTRVIPCSADPSCSTALLLTSMIRLSESRLCWLDSGGVQGSTDDLEGKRVDVMHEFVSEVR